MVIKRIPGKEHMEAVTENLKNEGFYPLRITPMIFRRTGNKLLFFTVSVPKTETDVYNIKKVLDVGTKSNQYDPGPY